MTQTTMHDLFDLAKSAIETEEPGPDEDWMSTLLLVNEEGQLVIGALLLDSSAQQAAAVHELIVQNAGVAAALVNTVWMISSEDGIPREDVRKIRPSEHPARRESVNVLLADIAGHMELHQALIERHEDASPTLGEWRDLTADEANPLEGRFPFTLRRAFDKVARHVA